MKSTFLTVPNVNKTFKTFIKEKNNLVNEKYALVECSSITEKNMHFYHVELSLYKKFQFKSP